MDQKQQLCEWLDRVERFSAEQKLPMRLLDRISECRESVLQNGTDGEKTAAFIEDILSSIRLKTGSGELAAPYESDSVQKAEIPAEKIRKELENAANRCSAENKASVNSYSKIKGGIVKRTHEQIQSLANMDAHFDEIQSSDKYLNYFRNIKIKYEKETTEMIESILNDISGNFDNMTDSIRIMFREIGNNSAGVNSEKIYHAYDIERENITAAVLNVVGKDEEIGKEISELGKNTAGKVRQICTDADKQRKRALILPAAIVGGLAAVWFIVSLISAGSAPSNAHSSDSGLTFDGLVSGSAELAENIGAISSGMSSILGMLPSFGILLAAIIVGYIIYAKVLRNKYNSLILHRCEDCLRTEFIKFERENILMSSINNVIDFAVSKIERKHLDILNSIFSGSSVNASEKQLPEKNEFNEIIKEWNSIKTNL